MNQMQDQADRLDLAVAAMLHLQAAVEAAAPWGFAELYGTEAEASWGAPELLAHVDEMMPFWLGETERILDRPGPGPVPFGRVASDSVRIGIIGRDRTLPPRELFARLRADGARMAARLRDLTDAEAARVGLHPRLGTMTIADLVARFVTGHLEEHVEQLRAILAIKST